MYSSLVQAAMTRCTEVRRRSCRRRRLPRCRLAACTFGEDRKKKKHTENSRSKQRATWKGAFIMWLSWRWIERLHDPKANWVFAFRKHRARLNLSIRCIPGLGSCVRMRDNESIQWIHTRPNKRTNRMAVSIVSRVAQTQRLKFDRENAVFVWDLFSSSASSLISCVGRAVAHTHTHTFHSWIRRILRQYGFHRT